MPTQTRVHVTTTASPIIRWAGSKRRLIPDLMALVPVQFNRYYEPFVGSGCLFFALGPDHATLGDINRELISTYRTLRRNAKKVVELVEAYPRSTAFYYKLRDRVEPANQLERTARFIYLNRFCFNGLYRTNRAGKFNVPRGNRTGDLPELEHFLHAAKKLRSAYLVCGDFEKTLTDVSEGDFVYLDPPYVSTTCKDRNEYGSGSFKPSDISRLMATLRKIHSRGAQFLLSYSTAPDFIQQLPQHTLRTISVRRSIASNPIFRSSVPEVLLNNANLF